MKHARVLKQAELKRVLTVAAVGKHGPRNRLALLLSHYAGLRVGEIASLRWDSLLETDGSVKAVFHLNAKDTKSNEARSVHVSQALQMEPLAFNKNNVATE